MQALNFEDVDLEFDPEQFQACVDMSEDQFNALVDGVKTPPMTPPLELMTTPKQHLSADIVALMVKPPPKPRNDDDNKNQRALRPIDPNICYAEDDESGGPPKKQRKTRYNPVDMFTVGQAMPLISLKHKTMHWVILAEVHPRVGMFAYFLEPMSDHIDAVFMKSERMVVIRRDQFAYPDNSFDVIMHRNNTTCEMSDEAKMWFFDHGFMQKAVLRGGGVKNIMPNCFTYFKGALKLEMRDMVRMHNGGKGQFYA
jgi:hypothetical protein